VSVGFYSVNYRLFLSPLWLLPVAFILTQIELKVSKISGSHSSEYEDYRFLGCCAV
jgi:hypothetical protein